jgi:hypothetical protein
MSFYETPPAASAPRALRSGLKKANSDQFNKRHRPETEKVADPRENEESRGGMGRDLGGGIR